MPRHKSGRLRKIALGLGAVAAVAWITTRRRASARRASLCRTGALGRCLLPATPAAVAAWHAKVACMTTPDEQVLCARDVEILVDVKSLKSNEWQTQRDDSGRHCYAPLKGLTLALVSAPAAPRRTCRPPTQQNANSGHTGPSLLSTSRPAPYAFILFVESMNFCVMP